MKWTLSDLYLVINLQRAMSKVLASIQKHTFIHVTWKKFIIIVSFFLYFQSIHQILECFNHFFSHFGILKVSQVFTRMQNSLVKCRTYLIISWVWFCERHKYQVRCKLVHVSFIKPEHYLRWRNSRIRIAGTTIRVHFNV